MNVRTVCIVSAAAIAFWLGPALYGRVILTEDFEHPSGWKRIIRGDGTIRLVDDGVRGRCLEVVSRKNALVYFSRPLPPEQVRGKKVLIRCKVRLKDVVRGPRSYSTAKIHLRWQADGRTFNAATRFVGTSDWHDEMLAVDLPPDAEKIVLDLGIQNGTGTAWYDELTVDDGVYPQRFVDLAPVANCNFIDEEAGDGIGFLDAGFDLRALPAGGVLLLGGVPFRILSPARNFGRTCVVLRGAKRPDLPDHIETIAPVKSKVARLHFLLAAAWCDVSSRRLCLVCTVHYDDGSEVTIPFREGLNIGPLEQPQNLTEWKVAWQEKSGAVEVGLGRTTWTNPHPEKPVSWLRFSTPGNGAVPVIVAISLDPP